jgi:hypothetical protein
MRPPSQSFMAMIIASAATTITACSPPPSSTGGVEHVIARQEVAGWTLYATLGTTPQDPADCDMVGGAAQFRIADAEQISVSGMPMRALDWPTDRTEALVIEMSCDGSKYFLCFVK